MKRHFQIVHFVPDPMSGTRVPMGAIIKDGRSQQVAIAPRLPGADCLGSREAARLLNFLIDDLQNLDNFHELYQQLGPEVFVDSARPIPAEVNNPVAWLEKFVLPRPLKADEKKTRPRRSSRHIEGKRFLEKYDVGQYVRRSFTPQKLSPGLTESFQNLRKITQWVIGDGRVLLMEPFVPRRPDWEDNLTDINTNFSAYHYQIKNGLHGHHTNLIAYILPGGTEKLRHQAKLALKSADTIVDTTHLGDLTPFIEQVRTVGEGQNELDL